MDAKSLCNRGLGLLGSFTINSIAPANTPLERFCANMYPQARDSEIIKRRWVFAWFPVTLTVGSDAPHATATHPYAFDMPSQALAPVRTRGATWRQHGRKIYAQTQTLDIEFKMRVPETDFDILFNDVLALRIAMDCCEFVTQSRSKRDSLETDYKRALAVAAANNALILGAEDSIHETDGQDEWLSARAGWGL